MMTQQPSVAIPVETSRGSLKIEDPILADRAARWLETSGQKFSRTANTFRGPAVVLSDAFDHALDPDSSLPSPLALRLN